MAARLLPRRGRRRRRGPERRLLGYAGLRAPAGRGQGDIQTITIAASRGGRARPRPHARAHHAGATRDVAEVFLEVRADNPVAQALYASEGFVEIGCAAATTSPTTSTRS